MNNMTERIIERAVEAIESGEPIEALAIVNDAIEEPARAEEAKEEMVKEAYEKGAFSDAAIGEAIRKQSKRRKIARSEDPEINRMMIRSFYRSRHP